MPQAVGQLAPPAPINGLFDGLSVGQQHAHEGGQLVGLPVARDEALGKSDIAPGERG